MSAARSDAKAVGAEEVRRRSASVEDTERLGEALAPALQVGDVVALIGPLGAGKTRFVAGVARGLAAAGRVRSPSFTIANEYRGRLLLLHLDLYRIDPMDAYGLGLEEDLERGAMLVEWGEKLPRALLAEALELRAEILSPTEREWIATASSGRGLTLLGAWNERTAELG